MFEVLSKMILVSTSNIIYTQNIFILPLGNYPTFIRPTLSYYTCRVYVPITCQKGFNQRCNHERLHIKWVKRKRVAFDRHLAILCQDMSDDVAANYTFPPLNNALGVAFPANSPRSSLSNDTDSCDNWVHVGGSIH